MKNFPCSCRDTLLGFHPAALPRDQEETVAHDCARSGLRFSGFAGPVPGGLGDDAQGELTFEVLSPLAGGLPDPWALQCFQVALRMLDACPGSAAELQREDFDRQIFQQLRDDTPDLSNSPVSPIFFFFFCF